LKDPAKTRKEKIMGHHFKLVYAARLKESTEPEKTSQRPYFIPITPEGKKAIAFDRRVPFSHFLIVTVLVEGNTMDAYSVIPINRTDEEILDYLDREVKALLEIAAISWSKSP
jgi:hypothetical protein